MTLFIAYILMDYIGGFSTISYVLVFILWLLHIGYHSDDDNHRCRYRR